MLDDIVIDTNIFMHAHNSTESRRGECVEFLNQLYACHTSLCVDEGFSAVEAKNRSSIGSEYLKHLVPGMLGHALISYLAANRRIKMMPRHVPRQVAKVIRKNVGSRPDQIFVRIAFKSATKTLASHDFGDLPQAARTILAGELNISIIDACAACSALA